MQVGGGNRLLLQVVAVVGLDEMVGFCCWVFTLRMNIVVDLVCVVGGGHVSVHVWLSVDAPENASLPLMCGYFLSNANIPMVRGLKWKLRLAIGALFGKDAQNYTFACHDVYLALTLHLGSFVSMNVLNSAAPATPTIQW